MAGVAWGAAILKVDAAILKADAAIVDGDAAIVDGGVSLCSSTTMVALSSPGSPGGPCSS
jgi:hypothetical protein